MILTTGCGLDKVVYIVNSASDVNISIVNIHNTEKSVENCSDQAA